MKRLEKHDPSRILTLHGLFDFHKALNNLLSIGEVEIRWDERDLTVELPCWPIDQTL